MSSNSALAQLVQQFIPLLPSAFAGRYSTLCSAVLLVYDYLLTLPLEIRHIWHGKLNMTKILYILNRYSRLISICRAFYYIDQIFDTLTGFAIFGIFTLRTYAIYGRSKIVLFLLAFPAFVNWSSGIWGVVGQTTVALPPELQIGPYNCVFEDFDSFNAGLADLVNVISAAVFDVLVVIFTVYRTGRLALQSREAKISRSLSFILLRDGIFYYGSIFVPQLVIVVLNVIVLKTGSVNLNDVSGSLTSLNASLQIILINRLVLNLSHAANANDDSEFRTRTGLEPLSFASGLILGNIGGPVLSFPDDDWDYEVPDESEGHVMGDTERAVKETEITAPSDVNKTEDLNDAGELRPLTLARETSLETV